MTSRPSNPRRLLLLALIALCVQLAGCASQAPAPTRDPFAARVASAGAVFMGEPGTPDTRGSFGIKIDGVSDATATVLGLQTPRGALVVEVLPGGATELMPFDVVLEVAGQPVVETADLVAIVVPLRAGTKTTVRVWRRRAVQDLVVELKSRAAVLAGVAGSPR